MEYRSYTKGVDKMNITFEHGHIVANEHEDKHECYKLQLHAESRNQLNPLWTEVRDWLTNQDATHTILINKYNRKGKVPYCLCWKKDN